SMAYRARKFLRRNRGVVAAAATVLLALVGGIIGATWGMVEARESERFASKETEEKTKALNKAVEDFNRAEKAEQHIRHGLPKQREASNNLDAALVLQKNSLYSLGIPLADREWFANTLAGMKDALKTCPPDRRNWEWQFLANLPHRDLHTLHPPRG